MSTIDLNNIGNPVPVEWQVQQVQLTHPRTGAKEMLVKLILSTPQGLTVLFLDGNAAEGMASTLKRAGKHAKTGTWSPDGGPIQRRDEVSGTGTPDDPRSASTAEISGQ